MSREIVFMNSRIAPKSVAAREEIAVEEGHSEEETRDRDDVILMFEKCLSLSDEISEVDTQQRSQEVSARESAREAARQAAQRGCGAEFAVRHVALQVVSDGFEMHAPDCATVLA